MKSCVTCESLLHNTELGNALVVNDTGNYHDTNSGMKLTSVLNEPKDCFASIDYRIY